MSERGSILFKNSVAETEAVIDKTLLLVTIFVGLLNPGEGVAINYTALSLAGISFALSAALAVILTFRLNITDNPDGNPVKPMLKKLHVATLALFSLAMIFDIIVCGFGINGFA